MRYTLQEAAEVAAEWMRLSESKGRPTPAPTSPEALREMPDVRGALREGAVLGSVVVVRESGRPVKANLSLDAGVLAAIDATAQRLGLTRSGFIELLARRTLQSLA